MPYILPNGISETMSEFNSGSGWGSHSKKVIRIGKPWANNYVNSSALHIV